VDWERWRHIVRLRSRSLLRADDLDRELDEELRYHLGRRTEELIAEGFRPEEAGRQAALDIGTIEPTKEECRDARSVRLMRELWQDLHYAARLLRHVPAFTGVASALLAGTIAGNAFVLSWTYATLVRPLPFRAPDDLFLIWEEFAAQHLTGIPFSGAEVNDLQRSATIFGEVAAFRHVEFNLIGGAMPERIHAAVVTPNLFSILGRDPIGGQTVAKSPIDGDRTVLLGEELWRRYFGSDPAIAGKRIRLSGHVCSVAGIMPRSFQFPPRLFEARGPSPGTAEIWEVREASTGGPETRSSRIYGVLARVSNQVSRTELERHLATIASEWERRHPELYAGRGFHLRARSLREEIVGRVRLPLIVVTTAALFLFAVAIANLIAMQLARAIAREKEFALRSALGASRARLFRQALTEGLLLAAPGGIAASVLAAVFRVPLRSFTAAQPIIAYLDTGAAVSFFALFLTAVAGALLGGLPGWKIAGRLRPDALRENERIATGSRRWSRIRDALLIGETAVALALLIAAGLLMKSMFRLKAAPLGFDDDRVLTGEISLPPAKYPTDRAMTNFFSTALARLARAPEIAAIGLTSVLPLSGVSMDSSFTIEGRANVPNGPVPDEEIRSVTPGYFEALRTPILRGRLFTAADNADAPSVAVINEAFARRHWNSVDVIGERIHLNDARKTRGSIEIVGVVAKAKDKSLDAPERAILSLPLTQLPFPVMIMVARLNATPKEAERAIRAQLADLDPEQPLANVRSLRQVVSESIAPRKSVGILMALFAGAATVLGAAGFYGVLVYSVAQRRREIALRVALGAQRGDILRLVFRHSFRVLLMGALAGSLLSITAARAFDSLLHRVPFYDPITFLSALGLLAAMGALTTYLAARKAAELEPAPILRGA